LESADDSVLKSMKKGITVAQILQTLKNTKDAGIALMGCGFIFGDTEESMETARNTLDWLIDNNELLKDVNLGPIILYPGSALYNKAVKDGKIKDTIEFIRNGRPVINVSKMTDSDFNRLIGFELPKTEGILRKKAFFSSKFKYSEKISRATNGNEYTHSRVCDNCGMEVISNLRPQDMMMRFKRCPDCGKIIELFPDISYFQAFEGQITEILSRDNVVIWGAGILLNELYQVNEFFRNNNITIVDSSTSKQNIGFYDKPVFDPAIINDLEEVNDVLFVISHDSRDLFHNHKEAFQNVKNFYWIFDVGLLDPMC
jgi:predicted RNA-binding Zn-ribbon protein involved in translation (DUF1610 family)